MDEEKKKQINNAISVLKKFCKEQDGCGKCPVRHVICTGEPYTWLAPAGWAYIE